MSATFDGTYLPADALPATGSHIDRPRVAIRMAGLVLLVAAALTAYAAYRVPPLAGRGSGTAALTAGEWLLGVAFLAAVWERGAWVVAVMLFGAFGVYNVTQILAGSRSCGCFGVLELNPWAALAIDAGLVTLLLTYPPTARTTIPTATVSRRARFATVTLVGVGGAALLFTGIQALAVPLPVLSPRQFDGKHAAYLLEPESWAGRRLPIAGHIDGPGDVMTGVWDVMLYRVDCPPCQAKIAALKQSPPGAGAGRRTLLLEVPPHKDLQAAWGNGMVAYARLRADVKWVVATPAEFVLTNGIVAAPAPPAAGSPAAIPTGAAR